MRSPFTKKQTALAVAGALALGLFSATVNAQSLRDVTDQALLTDGRGATVMSGYGLCWHSQFGPTPAANVVCGPQPVAQYVAPVPAPYVAPYVAPAPVYVAPAPAPAPVVVAVVAPQPVYEKVVLDADTLFDFDKATLRPAGRDTLDKFVKGLDGINPSAINAVGHTDRVGTPRYNMGLSERRVESVKTYLVSKGIQSGQVHTSAKGETQPMTKAGECKGTAAAKFIACLQPDRRVELEVSGSRLKQ
jgi:OOP family OmpA-OmpF porin